MHIGFTAAFVTGAKLLGYNANAEIAVASFIGGVLLDTDKAVEIVVNREKAKKGQIPDITARCRILHSIFTWPFGWILSFYVNSWLPLVAVLIHALADSAIPGLIKDGRHYSSHPPLKWIAMPFSKKWWSIVTIGWPVTYPPKFNWVYEKLCPVIGAILLFLSVSLWLIN